MYIPHLVTLAEAAEFLEKETGATWSAKSVLDFALTSHKQPNGKPSPVAYFAPHHDTRFGRYIFQTGDTEPTLCGGLPWQLVPLYPFHAGQIVATGYTSIGTFFSLADDHSPDNEPPLFPFKCIAAMDGDLLVSLDSVRLQRRQLQAISSAYCAAPVQTARAAEQTPQQREQEIKKRVAEMTKSKAMTKTKAFEVIAEEQGVESGTIKKIFYRG